MAMEAAIITAGREEEAAIITAAAMGRIIMRMAYVLMATLLAGSTMAPAGIIAMRTALVPGNAGSRSTRNGITLIAMAI